MMKGKVESIVAKEPEFGYVHRSVRFDQDEHGIKVTIENVFDNLKDVKEMILNYGEAWHFYNQAVWRAESVHAWIDENTTVCVWEMEDEE